MSCWEGDDSGLRSLPTETGVNEPSAMSSAFMVCCLCWAGDDSGLRSLPAETGVYDPSAESALFGIMGECTGVYTSKGVLGVIGRAMGESGGEMSSLPDAMGDGRPETALVGVAGAEPLALAGDAGWPLACSLGLLGLQPMFVC